LSGTSNPLEQATIGRSLVIKGEISGAEALYIDGRIEGVINVPENRVTIGRNGSIQANINARELVIMGKVNGNVECSDRLDIRGEGSLTGDVVTQRISVEDGAVMRGSIQVRAVEVKGDSKALVPQPKPPAPEKPAEHPKAVGATAGA
jgi:cytoskeletal protein CcmA (bactofilin family)